MKRKPFPDPANPAPDGLTRNHLRRLRQYFRSAGWPCQDMLEVELLDAGLLQRLRDADGRETLRVTDAGVAKIRAYLTEVSADRIKTPLKAAEIPKLFTSETFCKMVIREQKGS